MSNKFENARQPGQRGRSKNRIFQEYEPQGRATSNYVLLDMGQRLPATSTDGNLWVPRTIYDLHAGMS